MFREPETFSGPFVRPGWSPGRELPFVNEDPGSSEWERQNPEQQWHTHRDEDSIRVGKQRYMMRWPERGYLDAEKVYRDQPYRLQPAEEDVEAAEEAEIERSLGAHSYFDRYPGDIGDDIGPPPAQLDALPADHGVLPEPELTLAGGSVEAAPGLGRSGTDELWDDFIEPGVMPPGEPICALTPEGYPEDFEATQDMRYAEAFDEPAEPALGPDPIRDVVSQVGIRRDPFLGPRPWEI